MCQKPVQEPAGEEAVPQRGEEEEGGPAERREPAAVLRGHTAQGSILPPPQQGAGLAEGGPGEYSRCAAKHSGQRGPGSDGMEEKSCGRS